MVKKKAFPGKGGRSKIFSPGPVEHGKKELNLPYTVGWPH